MSYRIKVLDLELAHALSLPELDDCASLQALVKFCGSPVGTIQLPVSNGKPIASIAEAIFPTYTQAIIRELEQARIAQPELLKYIRVGISRYRDQWMHFVCLGCWKLARLLLASLRPGAISPNLVAAELRGGAKFPFRLLLSETRPFSRIEMLEPKQSAMRLIDLDQPLPDLTDVGNYRSVRVFVTARQIPVGSVDIEHGGQSSNHQSSGQSSGQSISAARLRQAIADQLGLELLALPYGGDKGDLANCLHHLRAQHTARPVEIIVADNRPASGLTPPVVAQFSGVKLVSKPRLGSSYGRNAAIAASTGAIMVSVDDDVTVPPDWLEKLIAPFGRPEVMVVTGNVLPLELDMPAQLMFETLKGGLGEGFKSFEVDGDWWTSFQVSPPTWDLGVSANAAFRATLFSHPQIGLMDEVLRTGTPTGGGEENHLIYKVLREGYTLVYEPTAFVWHKHRRELAGLYQQVSGHMKGGTAYNLLWLRLKDQRGFRQLIFESPRYYTKQITARLRGQQQTPWRFLWGEIARYFAGYGGCWQNQRRVKQQGRSAPYVRVAQRSSLSGELQVLEPVNQTQLLTEEEPQQMTV